MRAVLLALAVVFLAATPATAQLRDPFEPAIAPATTTTGGTTGATTVAESAAQPAPTSETLGNTGADVQGWVVIAFALMSVGVSALYLFKLYARPL